jgi:hypothetical protein
MFRRLFRQAAEQLGRCRPGRPEEDYARFQVLAQEVLSSFDCKRAIPKNNNKKQAFFLEIALFKGDYRQSFSNRAGLVGVYLTVC